jgi:catechol 2,3-dioxygenase-like lactoylglutathione lyase family enzyme
VPKVERVDFVSIPTRDAARARRFYGEILGLPRSRDSPDEFETSNLTLVPWQPEAKAVRFAPNTAGIALRVNAVEAARKELEARGVKFLGETVDRRVPDGLLL